MQDERLALLGLDEGGQVVLTLGGVDVGVSGVVEDPEEVVESDIDAGRLDQAVVERIDTEPAGLDLGADVAIGEQHGTSVAADRRAPGRQSLPERASMAGFALHFRPVRTLGALVKVLAFVFESADVVQWQNISFPS